VLIGLYSTEALSMVITAKSMLILAMAVVAMECELSVGASKFLCVLNTLHVHVVSEHTS
jgi:hypothetical protein